MSNKPKNILFRVDSSSTIGTGHIMRDLVLAEQFKDANIIFATQDLSGNINHKIKEKEYTIEILNSNDIEEVNKLIEKYSIDMIVIDHYGIDEKYEKQLKIARSGNALGVQHSTLKIMSLDDTYEKHYCDILLNHNIYADSSRYKNLVPENCELRCGSKYTLLRDEFIKVRSRKTFNIARSGNALGVQHSTFNIFLAMGGADHSNLNIKILKVLEVFPNIHVNVVTTTANRYLKELQEYVADKNNITLHINTDKIARLMNEADFAIVTPSVTVNEVVYMDIPLIAIKTAENQDEMYKYLATNNYLVLEKFNKTNLKSKIENILDSINIELVDFIDLSLDEKQVVLEWRNHPNIRKWMFTQEVINLHDHLNYIDSLKRREDRIYFLVKQASIPIGVIDFTNIDHDNKQAEFGIYSDPAVKGIGNILMNAIIRYAFHILRLATLISEVFEDNTAAIKLYNRYNFNNVERKKMNDKNVICMELKNENR